MPIELKGLNYYSKVFKRINYRLSNSTFWVVISKLTYKRNIREEGNLEFYVAKTIAKGYNLKLCFNYGKPIVILTSIRLLLSIAVCLIYEIKQLNIFIAKVLVCTRRHKIVVWVIGRKIFGVWDLWTHE